MFDVAFMRVALLASVAAAAPLAVVGVYLVVKRVVFLGLVLANAAAVGIVVAPLLGWTPELAAVSVTLGTSIVLGMLPVPRRVPAESIIGWAYAAASSAIVLILAGAATGDADTLHLLYGNVLAVSPGHAAGLAVIAGVIGVVQIAFGARFMLVTFDAEAAEVAGVNTRLWATGLNLTIGIAAATAVHEIGALLTFSLLTLPAMAALLVARRIRTTFAASAAIGVIAVWAGLVVAFRLDLPPGPLSVGVLVIAVAAAAGVGRWRG